MPRELMTDKQTGHYWRLKSGDYDGVDIMQGYMSIQKVAELESKLKWKTPEIDGMPEKGVYLLKIDDKYLGWAYRTARIVDGEFLTCHDGVPRKPNYYRLIEYD